MKNYFIDCGVNLGQGLFHFDKKYNFDTSWEILLFEPNPYLAAHIKEQIVEPNKNLKNLNIVFFPQAVCGSQAPEEIEFSMHKQPEHDAPIGGGSTIVSSEDFLEEETEGYEKCTVKTVRLSDVVRYVGSAHMEKNGSIAHLDKSKCNIVVKLDVEGEEYNIIEDLLSTGTAWWIKELHVEFHNRRFKKDRRADEVRLIGELFQRGVVCYPHY
tara:strand:- start:4834 stop:5472 length:639 start_codon:yes stop_codon:yes gene_type:complete